MPKKLLMTTDTVGGVWTYALELARALRDHNVEVGLATMGRSMSASQQFEAKSLENVRVFESGFRLEWMEDPWDDVTRARVWLLKVRDLFQPDVIHLNGYVYGSMPWNLPVLMVGHSCVFSWWGAVHRDLPPSGWNRYRKEVALGLRGATHVLAPSRQMMQSLETLYGPLPSTSVVPNGRNPELFRFGKKTPIILSAGRIWDDAKNIESLARIAGQLRWPVYLAGENRFDGSGKDLPAGGDGRSGVNYLGLLPGSELAEWMARAPIFVMPARYEPFGLTILEAAFSGCALVLGDIPSLRENWDGAATFVPPDDQTRLGQVLEDLMQDPRQLNDLGLRAYERAGQFTAQRMARTYMNTYEALCDSFSSITR